MKILFLMIFGIICTCNGVQKKDAAQRILLRHPACCSKTIKANPGDTLVFRFTEYPGRAYTWMSGQTEKTDKVIFLYDKRTQLSTHDDAPEAADYYFLCKKSGEVTLTFRYVRPWEINKAAADTCAVKVKIH